MIWLEGGMIIYEWFHLIKSNQSSPYIALLKDSLSGTEVHTTMIPMRLYWTRRLPRRNKRRRPQWPPCGKRVEKWKPSNLKSILDGFGWSWLELVLIICWGNWRCILRSISTLMFFCERFFSYFTFHRKKVKNHREPEYVLSFTLSLKWMFLRWFQEHFVRNHWDVFQTSHWTRTFQYVEAWQDWYQPVVNICCQCNWIYTDIHVSLVNMDVGAHIYSYNLIYI